MSTDPPLRPVPDDLNGGQDRRVDPSVRSRIDRLEARYRVTARNLRLAILALTIGIVGGLLGYGRLISRVQTGRRASVAINCATTNAIIAAGRATITGGTPGPPRFVRNLQRLGYPPPDVRTAQARDAANRYTGAISAAVARQSSADPRRIVRADGSLRCGVIQHLAQTK